jgi:KDO2-lipid IV(A) lauroyltransferase
MVMPINFIVYLIFRSFFLAVYILPFRLTALLGRLIGKVYYLIDRDRQRTINANICVVFGRELDAKRRQALGREACEYLVMHMLDILKLHKISNPENYRKFIEIKGLPHLMKSIDRGKGTIAVSGHFGNFLLLRYICFLNIPPRGAIIRELNNPYLERFFGSIVKGHSAITIRPNGAIKRMQALLPQNAVIATLADQKAGGNHRVGRHGIVVDFFGIPSQTHITAPLLARRTGASIIPVFVIRKGPGRYRIEFNEPMELTFTANEARDLERSTMKLNGIFEDYIKRYPEHWFWLHRRWKDIPGLEGLYHTDNPMELIEGFRKNRARALM